MKGLFQMKKENQRVEKLCSFYVSDWHFATMLLPYINHQIEKQVNVITLLENNSAENIEILVKKLNLKNEEVTEFNHHIVEILNSHDRVLNTSGEKEIAEVFEGYTKQEIKQAVGNV